MLCWKLLEVRLGRARTECGDYKQSTAVFSKIPIRLSDDASFRVRVRYAGITYRKNDYCYQAIYYEDREPHHRIPIEEIVLQGPFGADWRMAFRDPVTRTKPQK